MFRKLSFYLAALASIAAAACTPDSAYAQIINPNPPSVAASAIAGTGLSQAGAVISVNYGVAAGTAMQGNTSAVPAWHTTNAIAGSTNVGPLGMGTLTWSDTNIFGSWQTSANSFTQMVLQNSNAGALASTGYLVSNDVGTATTFYGEFGMNSSGFTGSGAFNLPSATYFTSTSGDLAIGTTTANAIHFVVNNGATDALAISSAGVLSGSALTNYPIVKTVLNVAALRATVCVPGLVYADQGYTTLGDGGQSTYVCNGSDTTTADNGGSIIASASTFRLYLVTSTPNQYISAAQWGMKCDGTTVDTTQMQAAFTAGGNLLLPVGKTCVTGPLQVTANLNISAYGATLLQAPGTALTGNAFTGLWNILIDKTLTVHGGTYDGNATNQTDTFGQVDFLWDAAGSMKIYDATIQNTHGHAIRTGNIDNFSAAVFAHDIVLDHVNVIQCQTTSGCGDAVRIERSNRVQVGYCNISGGMSSVRTQLYDSDMEISNNESSFAWGDDGITIAMSNNLIVNNNNIHDNFSQGIEVDAVVNAQINGNLVYRNGHSGLYATEYGAAKYTNSATYWGTIATGYGTNYATQNFTAPLVPNLNTVFSNNQSFNNGNSDRLIGQGPGLTYGNNYVNNPVLTGGYTSQLSIEGGTLNLTGETIYENTFVDSATDTFSITFTNYQFTAVVLANSRSNLRVPLAQYAAAGMQDLNVANRYMQNQTLRNALLADVLDATSVSGTAVQGVTTGNQNYGFTGIFGGAPTEKLVRMVLRAPSGSQVMTITANLYNSSGTFVTTLATSNPTVTTAYQEFFLRVPASTSFVGNQVQIQLNVPVTAVTVDMSELNVFSSIN